MSKLSAATMTKDERARLRALADAATPGPWVATSGVPGSTDVMSLDQSMVASGVGPSDADFIAAAHEAAPRLLDALEEAEVQVRDLAAAVHQAAQCEARGQAALAEAVRYAAAYRAEERGAIVTWLHDLDRAGDDRSLGEAAHAVDAGVHCVRVDRDGGAR